MYKKNNTRKTVLVFGIGKLGGPFVDTLCMRFPHHRFILVSRDIERSQKRANLSQYLALQWGLAPEVIGEETNLHDISRTAELINKYNPDVVLNATTPFPFWKINHLPERERMLANNAGMGIWCAFDCWLPLYLTTALSMAASAAVHVNATYPDMTNTFLSSLECKPEIGIGNISNLVPGLQLAFARELSFSPKEIEIRMVGHHYVSYNAQNTQGCSNTPYDLTIIHPGGRLHFRGPNDYPFSILRRNALRVKGMDGYGVSIGSAATVVATLLGSSQTKHHSPGAKGLPGGYPVQIDTDGRVKLNLSDELSEQEAVALNTQAQVLDGISHVEAGRVIASPMAQEAHLEIIGTDLPEVTFSNVDELSQDTLARLNKRFNLGIG
jgi:hypothetical protein